MMRSLHRWLGFPIAIAMLYMSLTGILLNHPRLIAGVNAPDWALPPDMQSVNWGRGAILSWISLNDHTILAGGKGGLYSFDSTFQPTAFDNGLPESIYDGAIQSLHHDTLNHVIWAGTPTGLYYFDSTNSIWLSTSVTDDIKSIASNHFATYAFATDCIWRFENNQWIKVKSWADTSFSLMDWVFDLHSGAILGKPGKLLYDLAAIAMLMLAIGGLYLLCVPQIAKRLSSRFKKIAAFFVRYHFRHQRKYGWIILIPLFIIPLTGFFMKAPVSALLVRSQPTRAGIGKLQVAQWDSHSQTWMLADSKKIWQADPHFQESFQSLSPTLPVHPMGITGMIVKPDTLLISSFGGLILYLPKTQTSYDFISGKEIHHSKMYSSWQIKSMAPYQETIAISDLRKGWFQFQKGHWIPISPTAKSTPMPSTYSLWHFLFEVHNGRILRSWIPKLYLLHNPLVAIGTFLVMASGVVLVLRKKKPQNQRPPKP